MPTLYAAQLKSLGEAPRDLSSLRLCISAGEALPPDILKRWNETVGLDLLDGIGSTEMLHIFISSRPGDVLPGATGRIVPGYEARILDDDDRQAYCGGAMACATCHIYVDDNWLDRVPETDIMEDLMLDCVAAERNAYSRLSCQIDVSNELDGLVVRIPESQH